MGRAKLFGAGRYISCYLLLLPTYVLVSVFSFVPFIWAFSKSFYRYEVGGESEFIGFANYLEYFSDPTFGPSFYHMGFLTAFAVVVGIVVPLIVAKLIFSLRSEKLKHIYRLLFLAPIVVPRVAVLMIWRFMIYDDGGMINEFLRVLRLGEMATGWLFNPTTALWAVAFIGFPFASGIHILIFYAGLCNIPESVHEAALLDGATGARKFLTVDVPLVLSQIKLLVILTIISWVQGFEWILIVTQGFPGYKTMVPGLWMYYNAFSFQRMGYACSIGVILFLVILVLTVLNLRYFKSAESVQGVG